jgi:hypothetical protein
MILNPTVQTVELTYAGQEVEITETSTASTTSVRRSRLI